MFVSTKKLNNTQKDKTMKITITKHIKTLTNDARNELYNALKSINFEYIGTACNNPYQADKEYEFSNTIGTIKVTFTLEDLV